MTNHPVRKYKFSAEELAEFASYGEEPPKHYEYRGVVFSSGTEHDRLNGGTYKCFQVVKSNIQNIPRHAIYLLRGDLLRAVDIALKNI